MPTILPTKCQRRYLWVLIVVWLSSVGHLFLQFEYRGATFIPSEAIPPKSVTYDDHQLYSSFNFSQLILQLRRWVNSCNPLSGMLKRCLTIERWWSSSSGSSLFAGGASETVGRLVSLTGSRSCRDRQRSQTSWFACLTIVNHMTSSDTGRPSVKRKFSPWSLRGVLSISLSQNYKIMVVPIDQTFIDIVSSWVEERLF